MLRRSVVAACVALAVAVGTAVVVATLPAGAATTLLSQGKPATASSTENAGTPASAAFDGGAGTRWASAWADPQWLQVDLGASVSVCQVVLTWEAAYASAFQIQVSADAATWNTVYSTTTGTGGTQKLQVNGTGRYVRMYATARATGFGYSLWEFQVFTTGGGGGTGGVTGPVISQFMPVKASSWEGGNAPAAALDGRTTTRWSSLSSDPQWISVDLGGTAAITGVVLNWEAAYATGYHIDVSNDAVTWSAIYTTTTGKGGIENLGITGSGPYLRMDGTAPATRDGDS